MCLTTIYMGCLVSFPPDPETTSSMRRSLYGLSLMAGTILHSSHPLIEIAVKTQVEIAVLGGLKRLQESRAIDFYFLNEDLFYLKELRVWAS